MRNDKFKQGPVRSGPCLFEGIWMKFYTVNNDYINHLKSFDPRVPDNYEGKKPFFGVVLEVNGISYNISQTQAW